MIFSDANFYYVYNLFPLFLQCHVYKYIIDCSRFIASDLFFINSILYAGLLPEFHIEKSQMTAGYKWLFDD